MTERSGGLLTSLVTTLTHEARIIRFAGLAYTEARQREGLAAVERALAAYFDWRAATARGRGATDLLQMVQSWQTAELLAVNTQDWGELLVSRAGIRLEIRRTPELLHYESHGVSGFATVHYRALVSALLRAAGLDDEVRVDVSAQGLTLEGGVVDAEPAVRPGIDVDGDAGLQLLKATSQSRGALLVFLGREADQSFGADGEQMFREAVRGFGAERGAAMRLDHLSRGIELDLRSMMDGYDSGGNEDVWEYRDEGFLSPVEWSQDCTYCPFVRPWQDLEGLRYGEIYDHEFHVAQFKAYRDDIEVRWGELQSRGDATCEFRFSIKPGAAA